MFEKGVLFELEYDELDYIFGTKSRGQTENKLNSNNAFAAGSHLKITQEERKLDTKDLIVLQKIQSDEI